MVQEDILSLASQGEPRAIAVLLNQALRTRQIAVEAIRKSDRLHILLEAAEVPDRETYVSLIHNSLYRLKVSSIHSVRIYARQRGQKVPAWDEAFEMKNLPLSALFSVASAPEQPPSKTASSVAIASPVPAPQSVAQPPIPLTHQSHQPSEPLKPQSSSLRKPLSILLPALGIASFLLGMSWDIFKNADRYSPAIAFSAVTETLASVQLPNPPQFPLFPSSAETLKPLPTDKVLANFNQLSEFVESSIPATPITLKAVGDIVPGTNFPANKLPQREQVLFESVKPYLQGADLLFGNFESTLTNHPYSAKDVSRSMVFAFRTPPSYAKLLKEVGFDVLNLANNHSQDFGTVGLEDTVKNITNAGIQVVGKKDEILYLTVKNVPVAFIGFSTYDYHNSVLDLEAAKALVEEAKQKATIVVVSFHGGAEGTAAMHVKNRTEMFYGENRGNLVLFSRTMIDAGADLILGHGPHIPRALELYKGKLIAYSLGNFVGYRTLSTAGQLGNSLILEVELDIEGNFVTGKIIPVHLYNNGIPQIDQQFRTVSLLRNLTKSDFPETQLVIDKQGKILLNK